MLYPQLSPLPSFQAKARRGTDLSSCAEKGRYNRKVPYLTLQVACFSSFSLNLVTDFDDSLNNYACDVILLNKFWSVAINIGVS